MDSAGKLRAIEGINWFHRIDLGGGIVTPGIDDTPFKIGKLKLPEVSPVKR
jgi:hypothetical protein